MIVEHVMAQKKLATYSGITLSIILLTVALVLVVIALLPNNVLLKSVAVAYVVLP